MIYFRQMDMEIEERHTQLRAPLSKWEVVAADQIIEETREMPGGSCRGIS